MSRNAPFWMVAVLTMVGSPIANGAAPQVAAFFEKNCVECHDTQTKEGGLDLSELKFDPATPENFAKWVWVFDRVRKGEMPRVPAQLNRMSMDSPVMYRSR
jgi:hypothetical protein